MMKVVVVIDSIDLAKGGTSRSSTSVVDQLSAAYPEFEILLVTRKSANPIITNFPTPNARVSFHNEPLSALLSNRKFFVDADVIHIQGIWSFFPSIIGIVSRILFTAKLVISPRGMLEEWSLNQKPIKKRLALKTYQGWLFRKADIVHVTAANEKTSVSKLFPGKFTCQIPNGISTATFEAATHDRLIRKRKILFLSRIHPKKGIEILLHSWMEMSQLWPDWEIEIVGDGDAQYIQQIQSLISELQLESISISGPVYGADKAAKYAQSDLFVLPTYSENFGIVIAEALISHLPVITTTGTPWGEIDKLGCGSIISPDKKELMNALMLWTKMTPSKRALAGEIGARLVEEKYSIASVATAFRDVFLRLAQKSSGI